MHTWKDLVFDVLNPDDRAQYIEENGAILPLTHEVDPVEHGNMCSAFRAGGLGADGYGWTVWARVYVDASLTVTDDGAGKPHPEVNFDSLDECLNMMLRAHEHARESSRPASDRPSKPPPSKHKASAKPRK